MNYIEDTICAISTPIGEGGISVIRISGKKAFEIIERVFFKSKNKIKSINISDLNSHTIHLGYIFENNNLIDEVLISIFKNPNSFTGEDTVEVSTHGGLFITQKVLRLLISSGARHAEPGEFSKRAFLNGRIDLSQAEAISDLIKAKTEDAHKSSLKQLEGTLSEFINKIRDELITVTALVELELDFAEEDLEFTRKEDLKSKAINISNDLTEISNSYVNGKLIRDGINLVIAGKPNSGKSSLFNCLLKKDRAIVSHISGTTRDYIEEGLIYNGILFNITDTAGLRVTDDEIESEGIKRSRDKISDADLVLYLIDSTETIEDINKSIHFFDNLENRNKILVFTKKDIAKNIVSDKGIFISINDENSIRFLKESMVNKVKNSEVNFGYEKIIITNIRHKLCIDRAIGSLGNVIDSINNNMSGEFISIDLRNALSHLGEITGAVTNDDILTYVFSKFCIGK